MPKGYINASCEVRTHASFDSRVERKLKSTALDHSAKLAIRISALICVTILIHILGEKKVPGNIPTSKTQWAPFLSTQQENGNMGQEEQIEEREVLDSIFPDEITGASSFPIPAFSVPPTSPPSKYSIGYPKKAANKYSSTLQFGNRHIRDLLPSHYQT